MITAHRALEATLTADLAGVAEVTTDAAKAGALLPATPVVILDPPEVTWLTGYGAVDLAWSVYVVAGPPHDIDAAHARIWEVIDAISLDIDTARPASFQPQTGPTWPAYVLTITEPHDI